MMMLVLKTTTLGMVAREQLSAMVFELNSDAHSESVCVPL
jgi:hypothetical protein